MRRDWRRHRVETTINAGQVMDFPVKIAISSMKGDGSAAQQGPRWGYAP